MSIHIPSSEGEAVTAEVRTNLPDVLPILPLRDSVPFPETLTPLAIGQERSIQLINDVLAGNRMLAMVASKDAEDEEPGPDGIYGVGVAGVVARMLKVPDGTLRILVHGAQRVELGEFTATEPYLMAKITEAPDELGPRPSSRRSTATCRPPSRASSRSCRTCRRSSWWRSRTSTIPPSSRT